MDDSDILTFRAPTREPDRVDAAPSPLFELAYAAYTVAKRGLPPAPGPATPPWLRRLALEAPESLAGVATFWPARGFPAPGVEAFVLVAQFGYGRDEDPERFLGDLPVLAERFAAEGDAVEAGEGAAMAEELRRRVDVLRDGAVAAAWSAAYRALWRSLAPIWVREGRPAALEAADAFRAAYRTSGSVLEALPAHHFVQFEAASPTIRKAESAGRLLAIPLGLAVAGGFYFDVGGTLYIGFGLQTETVHERTAERVAALATRMKVFADPTRAMLLALIGRFSEVHLTVGDLAVQLGVSQPTVSGHLRLLREAGLVQLERRGNKAHHRLDAEAVHALLHDFETALVVGPADPDA